MHVRSEHYKATIDNFIQLKDLTQICSINSSQIGELSSILIKLLNPHKYDNDFVEDLSEADYFG